MTVILQSPASPFTGDTRCLYLHEAEADLIRTLLESGWKDIDQ